MDDKRENREQACERFIRDWRGLQDSSFFRIWASAAVDEMIAGLHERLLVGSSTAS